MAKMIRLDFRKAPPSSGGGSDRIPPGRYLLTISKVSEPDAKAKSSGKPMITVNFKVARGDLTGKRVQDNFVFPTGPDDQMFGLSRFHAMLIACGFAPPSSAAFRFDLEMLLGKSCWAEVTDNVIPAQGTRPERTVSRPDEYILPTQAQLEAEAPEEEEDEEYDDEALDETGLDFEAAEDDEEYDDEAEEGEDDPEYEPEPVAPPPSPEPIRARRPRPAQPAAEVAAQQQRRAPAPAQGAPAAPARQRNGRRPAPPADDSAFPFAQ